MIKVFDMILIIAGLVPASAASQVCANQITVPKYSNLARAAQWTGVVELTITVGAQGEVLSLDGNGAFPHLIDEAKKTVKQWVFCAADNNGSSHVRLRFDYRLEGAPVYPLPLANVVIDLGKGTILITSPPMKPQT